MLCLIGMVFIGFCNHLILLRFHFISTHNLMAESVALIEQRLILLHLLVFIFTIFLCTFFLFAS